MIEIRPFLEAELNLYRSIRLEALQAEPSAFGSTYEESSQRPAADLAVFLKERSDRFILGAFRRGQPVGLVSFRRHDGIKERHKGEINQMYVRSSHRRSGIARLLMNDLLARVRNIGDIERVQLSVVTDNAGAVSLYESFGFKSYGLEEAALRMDGRDYDEQLMVLVLGNL